MALAEAALGRALGGLAVSGLKMMLSPSASNRDERMSLWQVPIEDASGEIIGILTDWQAQDIADFLTTADVKSLVHAQFLTSLAGADNYFLGDAYEQIKSAFSQLAVNWCEGKEDPWDSYSSDLWELVVEYISQALPAESILTHLTQDEIKTFRDQMGGRPSPFNTQKAPPRFLRDLIEMSQNVSRLVRAATNVADIRKSLSDYYAQIRLEHAQQDYRIQIDDLYIERDLVDISSDATLRSESIFVDDHRVRLVITGDPGIGKSTFTEYLIRKFSEENIRPSATPLIIHCREFATGEIDSILAIVKDKLFVTLQLRCDEQELEDILTLGRAFLIVDGVDEILDLGRRRNLVRAVEAFGNRFPLCSIIATSRNIGYNQAKFDPAQFDRYAIHPFTDEQIEEYARRWFAITRTPDFPVDKFLREVNSIADLPSNPLMLSLLCILYRARGYIPRNRRQIYSQCADLLFNRWDSMRHIEQPFDHQHYGDELMQEIASWFYRSQSAQAGLEEQQIRKVIASFLTDTAAVPPPAAERRASAFLDFCADRAWLLGTAGTNEHGQRIFVFTHRTFMEFFAAESLVRGSEIDQVVHEVASAYDRDASSVLPDLIVQSAEVHRRGGAKLIIDGLLEKGRALGKQHVDKYLPLCLRIINLSPVNPRLMDVIFGRTLAQWARYSPRVTRESMLAVLDLYRDPRGRFREHLEKNKECITHAVCNESHPHPLMDFLLRWSHLWLEGTASPYEGDWKEYINGILPSVLSQLRHSKDTAVKHFLIEQGYIAPRIRLPADLIAPGLAQPYAGYAFHSLERILRQEAQRYDEEVVTGLTDYVERAHLKRERVSMAFAESLATVSEGRTNLFPYRWQDAFESNPWSSELKKIYTWICCATYEFSDTVGTFHDEVESVLGINFQRVFDTREFNFDRSSALFNDATTEPDVLASLLHGAELAASAADKPQWFTKWCNAECRIVYATGSGYRG